MHLTLYIIGEYVKQWPLQMPAINWRLPIGPQRDLQDAYIAGAMSIARAETEHLTQYEEFEFVLEAVSKFPEQEELKPAYIWVKSESEHFHLSFQKSFFGLNIPQGKR